VKTRKLVLLIEDDQEFVRLVNAALPEETFEVRNAPSVSSGLAMLEQFRPELILSDLNLPDSSGFDTFPRVRRYASGIPVVVLTSFDDDETAIRAVREGAQDYLVKSSFQPNLLARCVNLALTRQRQSSGRASLDGIPGSVLSFIGSKGGVGTSTTAVNTAAALARNGLQTVLIEWQPEGPGTLPLYMESEPSQDLGSLLAKPANTITPSDLRSCLMRVAGSRLLGLPASRGSWRALSSEHAHAIVAAARETFPFTILDLPPRIDEGVGEALKLSDAIVMIADPETASLACGAVLARQIRKATSPAQEISLALVERTIFDSPAALGDIQGELRAHPLVTIPHAAASIALSYSARAPMALLYPDDPFSLAHFELAEKLLATTPVGKHHALASRLTAPEAARVWETIPETTYG
jgi:CheY-like chemotaxis protein/MinD-like ATPase involved in chromosome partitioning or flagellar assembly